MKNLKQVKPLIILLVLVALPVLGLIYVKPLFTRTEKLSGDTRGGLEMVELNYGKQIDSIALIYNLPPEYLKSLCMLECSGRKVFKERYEPHVYRKLLQVKFQERDSYEHVKPEMLSDAGTEALKNLASSWGPFQLMGYKCLLLDIKVKDIRGEHAVVYGAKWIDLTYGKYLRQKKYADAFHIHNTGRPLPASGKPATYDPDYIKRGLKYMEHFKSGSTK